MAGQVQPGAVHRGGAGIGRGGLKDAAQVPGQRLGHFGRLQLPQLQRPAIAPADAERRQQPLVCRSRGLEAARQEHLADRGEQRVGVRGPGRGLLVGPAVAVPTVALVIGILPGGDPGRERVDAGQQVRRRGRQRRGRRGGGIGEDVEEGLPLRHRQALGVADQGGEQVLPGQVPSAVVEGREEHAQG